MSEFKRANAFGTGYIDTDKVFKIKFENMGTKQHFEIAGDENAEKAFNAIPMELVGFKWNKEQKKTLGADGKDYFEITITSPDGMKLQKLATHDNYMKLINEYHIVSEGKWKTWGKTADGKPKVVMVKT